MIRAGVQEGKRLGYLAAIRGFSRNARLYVVHVIGMDMIHGTWQVLFNLYLLAIGFDVRFVGLRLLIAGISAAVMSVPAGMLSDRIGRKASFILGDGMGAALGLVNILSTDRTVLLSTAALGSFFGALHHVSEPPFMHENSRRAERVHLFSVSASFRTASAMAGSLLAGFLPLLAAERVGRVTAYRWATFVGLGLWFLSLIPALMLRPQEGGEAGAAQDAATTERRGFLRGIRNGRLMAKLVVPEAFLALGGGMVIPLSNIFFSEHLHAHEGQIGVTFALGQGLVAIGALLAPLLVMRMSKVQAVAVSRLASLPFIAVLAAAAGADAPGALAVAMGAWVARTMLFNMSSPLESAFSMEILTLRERATLAGFDGAVFGGLGAAGAFIGSRLMAASNYAAPFVAMGLLHLVSIALFWAFFRRMEAEAVPTPVDATPAPAEA